MKGKSVAVVTGASSGIGKAIYEGLKDSFDLVLGLSRRGPDIFQDVRLVPVGHMARPVTEFCLSEPHHCRLLVNCAGIMPLKEQEHELLVIFGTNFWGTYAMVQNLLPIMQEGSCIINIASVSGIVGDSDLPIYSASKAAVISLTKSLAKRLAPKIRVNCISPGFYKTNLVPGDTPAELIEKVPLKFEEKPEALVPVVKMIYNTRYMTGANIVVDGGLSA